MADQNLRTSFSIILDKVQTKIEGVKTEFLKELAKDLTNISPVDTGDYVLSHTIGTQPSANSHVTTSLGKTLSGQNKKQKQEESFLNLVKEIDSLPKEANIVYVSNSVPHAIAVEYGGANWLRDGYAVYNTVENRANVYLADAIAKVKGST